MEVDQKPTIAPRYRFGSFEIDIPSGELRKAGLRVRLQAQPFRVLTILLEHAGEVVPREELHRQLWGDNTTVDFDHSLGTAINKIREALGDSADHPRFIETLAKRGYRFVAPVTAMNESLVDHGAAAPVENQNGAAGSPVAGAASVPAQAAAPSAPGRLRRLWPRLAAVAGILIVAAGAGVFLWRTQGPRIDPTPIREITYSGRVFPGEPLQESLAPTATDGSRIYFSQIENGRAVLTQALLGDGEASSLALPSTIVAPILGDISPDGSKLLVKNELARESEQPLWIVPTLGGAARQFSNIQAHDATWTPDGRRILYATGTELYLANEDGGDRRRFASLPGRAFWLRWSPDGTRLRFTVINTLNHITSLWEASADGSQVRPMLAGWSDPASECCGSWTPDGKYFVFQSAHSGLTNIWAIEEDSLLGIRHGGQPVEITNGPLSYQAPVATRGGHQILFVGLNTRSELLQFDPASKLFLPHNRTLNSAQVVEFSRDGQSVAWISPHDSSLWRSRADGSQRLQLTADPMQVFMMHWSPDGKQLVFMGRQPGQLWRIYLVDADGGNLHPVLNEARNESDPDWSPDGGQLVLGRLPDVMAERSQPKAIYFLDLKTGAVSTVPQSDGLFSPRWSPDGRYLTAMPLGQGRLMLFDRTAGQWRTLVDRPAADPVWSHDGHWIYFHDFIEESQAIYRVSVPDGRVEHVAGLGNLQSVDIADFRFVGLAPGDLPLIRARMSTANIYTTDLDDAARHH